MKKQSPENYLVNYDTKWTHFSLEPEQALYFKAKTPIQEIIPQLYDYLKKHRPQNLEETHQKNPYAVSNYNRVYRNLIKSYKGWEVLYREPDSKQDYGSITEKIGYQKETKNKNTGGLKTTLRRPMLWKHDLDAIIQPVEITKPRNCGVIAQTLNHQFKQADLNLVFKNWLLYINGLSQNYGELVKKDLQLDVLSNKDGFYQRFLKDLERVNRFSKQLNVLLNWKDYTLYAKNVNDVLTFKNKNAKGWRVQFLDERAI